MKKYQVINEKENGGEKIVIYKTTRKRDAERFLGLLRQGFKKDGRIVIKRNIGYFDLVSAYGASSYFIKLA